MFPDLKSSPSHGYGHAGNTGSFSLSGSGSSCFTINICPDLILAGIAAIGAAAFYSIYFALTTKGRRKRRDGPSEVPNLVSILENFGFLHR
jgi:hypothetical protein